MQQDTESLSSGTPGLDTLCKEEIVGQPQHSHVLFSRTREQISDSHRLMNCYNPECNWLLHPSLLFLLCKSTKSIAGSPASSPRPTIAAPGQALSKQMGFAPCLVLPRQATKAEAANPQFEVNGGYNLSFDSTLNFSSSWRQRGAHLTSRAACLAASPLCPSVLLVGQGCAPLKGGCIHIAEMPVCENVCSNCSYNISQNAVVHL